MTPAPMKRLSAQSDAQAYRDEKYRPEPGRQGVALCLSGGGFRAALFHLGALTRLNEIGLLGSVDVVSCVSGGSIVGALLADRLLDRWPAEGEVIPAEEWRTRVVEPLTAFTGQDLRTGPILRQLMPWNLGRLGAGPQALAAHYRRGITNLRLSELPERPRFIFCSTDLVFGVNFVFERSRIGSYAVGHTTDGTHKVSVARAVAASSCFPPIFNPMPFAMAARAYDDYRSKVRHRKHVPDWAQQAGGIELSDGGDYDNLGLEPVWKTCRVLLVSDGGAPFQVARDRGLSWRLQRYAGIATNQAGALRKRWLISSFMSQDLVGAYWGISSSADHYCAGATGYPEKLVRERIASIRTDLDVFSPAEKEVLQNHGYSLAAAAMQEHAPPGLPLERADVVLPYPDRTDAAAVDGDLRDSSKRSIPGHESWWRFPLKVARG
jgi:NTE family protein